MADPTHPDPTWWSRLDTVGEPDEAQFMRARTVAKMCFQLQVAPVATLHQLSLCTYCGHVRALHDSERCTSSSAGLFERGPCLCTNIASSSIFKDPTTLTQPTSTPNG